MQRTLSRPAAPPGAKVGTKFKGLAAWTVAALFVATSLAAEEEVATGGILWKPAEAPPAGAAFQVDGEEWVTAPPEVGGLPVGVHRIAYRRVPGWQEPPASE